MIPDICTIFGVAPVTAERNAAKVETLRDFDQRFFVVFVRTYVVTGPPAPPVVPPFSVA
jgi:hypothetical protein